MENNLNKKAVVYSLIWKLSERSGVQVVQLIIQIILARLLTPNEFGTIAIVMVFINIAQVFVQSGFNTALIQKKHVDKVDYSSTLYISLLMSLILIIVMFLLSPIISTFYNNSDLINILRVLSITFIFGSINSIQIAYISRNFLFKKLFFSSFIASIISGIVGILFAYNRYGAWSLVFQQLTNQGLIVVLLLFTVSWKPTRDFSLHRIKRLFSFGSKLLISSLINVVYLELTTLIIGKFYAPAKLGYYTRGQLLPKTIVTNVDGAIQSVMLPTLSASQHDKKNVKYLMRKTITLSSFFIFPMMIGMLVIAKPLILVLLTEKWIKSVPFLQLFCLSFILLPIHTANLQAINALGRSDIFLRLEIIKKIIGTAILILSVSFGLYAIIFGQIFNSIVFTFINSYPNKKLLNYGYLEQIHDILPSLVLSIIMGVVISFISFFNISSLYILILQLLTGLLIYILLNKLFKVEVYNYLLNTMKNLS